MQIVIDIPEELKQKIDEGFISQVIINKLWEATKNGTPLPKGHGRLIDAKEVYKKFYCRCLAGVAMEVLDETPTIIDADKESGNDI